MTAAAQRPDPHCRQTGSTYFPGSSDLLLTLWQTVVVDMMM